MQNACLFCWIMFFVSGESCAFPTGSVRIVKRVEMFGLLFLILERCQQAFWQRREWPARGSLHNIWKRNPSNLLVVKKMNINAFNWKKYCLPSISLSLWFQGPLSGKVLCKVQSTIQILVTLVRNNIIVVELVISRWRGKRYLFYFTYTWKGAAKRVKTLGMNTRSWERRVLELAPWGSHLS